MVIRPFNNHPISEWNSCCFHFQGYHSGINKSGPVFGLASCFPQSIAWSGALTIRWWPLFLGVIGVLYSTEILHGNTIKGFGRCFPSGICYPGVCVGVEAFPRTRQSGGRLRWYCRIRLLVYLQLSWVSTAVYHIQRFSLTLQLDTETVVGVISPSYEPKCSPKRTPRSEWMALGTPCFYLEPSRKTSRAEKWHHFKIFKTPPVDLNRFAQRMVLMGMLFFICNTIPP